MEPTMRQRLYKDPSYLSLPVSRRRLAHKIIVDGASFAAACRELGANSTRESKNIPLQILLATYAPAAATAKPKPQPWEDESREAEIALAELCERIEGKSIEPTVTDEARYAAEMATGQPITVSDVGLDGTRVARMVGLIRSHMKATLDSLNAMEARRAELARRTICDGCEGPLSQPGAIRGDNVVCPQCLEVWNKTGRKPEVAAK